MSENEDYLNSIFSPEEMQEVTTNAARDPDIKAHTLFHVHADEAQGEAINIAKHIADGMTNGTPIDNECVQLHVSKHYINKRAALLQNSAYMGKNNGQSFIPDDHEDTEDVKCSLCGKDISALFIDM
jgi:alkanesulfonate monooxygenase SsuD/methylene tetrahydromethanopterin reductase-like flavin-dependent oxidoreductase (luciferase family)